MKRQHVNTAPEIVQAQCVVCGAPILLHKLVTLPNGAQSLQRIGGRKRTRCEACQHGHENDRWYVTAKARNRKKRAEQRQQRGLLM